MRVLLCVLALVTVTLGAPNVPSGRIWGGSNAVRGQFPYIASLRYCIIGICSHFCGATIISPRWLISAAHCFTGLPGVGSVSVTAGILNQNDTNIEKQTVSIGSTIMHPLYAGGVNPHDVILIKMSSALILNTQVQVVHLPKPEYEAQGDFQLVGWGSVGGIIFPQMPNTLQHVEVPLVPIPQCDSALTTILQGAAHPLDFINNMCTGPLNAPITSCSGDSGGPLLQGNVLQGMVSWGVIPCGRADAPTVYAKVSRYIDWIQLNVDEPLSFA